MKIIDLMNKVANDEDMPRRIIYEDLEWEYRRDLDDYEYYDEDRNWHEYLFENPFGKAYSELYNDEIEILDHYEKNNKIEKLEPLQKEWLSLDDIKFTFSNSEMIIVNKINEIIDCINKGE